MKLNKTFGRIATTLVATAMLASMAVVPASAEGGVLTPSENKITLTKELIMPANMRTPAKTFTFNITTVTEESVAGDKIFLDNDQVNVRAGSQAVDDAGTATIQDGQSGTPVVDTKNKKVTAEFDLTLPAEEYKDAGVYKYQITEDAVGANYTDKTKTLDLYLIVERQAGEDEELNTDDDTFAVINAIVYPAGENSGSGSGKTETWTNYYMLNEETGVAEVGSITVTKKVTGAMGSKNDTFEFNIELPSGGDYSIIKGDGDPIDFTGGKFSLQADESATITGLPAGSYDITETITGGYEIESAAAAEGESNTVSAKVDNTETVGASATVVNNDDTAVVITNNREAVSPTGLIMDIAPYVLLVVVAAAGCFVFLRKRRED